jgi:hypothetical protein
LARTYLQNRATCAGFHAYIEFRALQGKSIFYALRELWAIDPGPILKEGRGLLLLDGLDEVTADHFEAIRRELDEMLTRDTLSRKTTEGELHQAGHEAGNRRTVLL